MKYIITRNNVNLTWLNYYFNDLEEAMKTCEIEVDCCIKMQREIHDIKKTKFEILKGIDYIEIYRNDNGDKNKLIYLYNCVRLPHISEKTNGFTKGNLTIQQSDDIVEKLS